MEEDLPEDEQARVTAARQTVLVGAPGRAHAILDTMPTALAQHPEVLRMRHDILEYEDDWMTCLDVAARMIQIEPGNACGWLARADAYLVLRRPLEAKETLMPVATDFRTEAVFLYTLARCWMALGEDEEAGT